MYVRHDQHDYTGDKQLFSEFLDLVEQGLPIETHPVFGLIRNLVYLLAHKFNRLNEVDELILQALEAVWRGQYRGESALGTYLGVVVRNKIHAYWKKGERLSEIALPDNASDIPGPIDERDATIRRIASDENLRLILRSLPDLQRKIAIMLMVEFEGKRISRNTVIEYFEKDYTKQQVINAFAGLRTKLSKYYLNG